MVKKIWSKLETMKFIALYKENVILWNPRAVDYKNLAKKRKILNNLSAEFNTTVVEIGRKIRILRAQWLKEYRKINAVDGKIYKSSWKWFKPLKPVFNISSTVIKNDSDGSSTDDNLIEGQEDDKYLFIRQDYMCNDGEMSKADFIEEDHNCLRSDEHQKFGNYVANKLSSMHYENNIHELKKLIKQHIVQWKEKDDKEYYSI